MVEGGEVMKALIYRVGQLIGLLGILLVVFAGGARLMGHHRYGDFDAATLLRLGADAVTVGCFLLLWLIAARDRN